MVVAPDRRRRKFAAKVDADVLRQQTLALKHLMVQGQSVYFPDIATVEGKVKVLVEAQGVTTLKVRDYLNFAREMYKLSKKFQATTLQAEAQVRVDKWVARGLTGSLLIKVAQLFGITPTAPAPTVIRTPQLMDFLKVGRFYNDFGLVWYAPTFNTIGADWFVASRFAIHRKLRFDKIGYVNNSLNPISPHVSVGIYNSNQNYYPNALLFSHEFLNVISGAWTETDLDLTLDEGVYWLAFLSDDTGVELYILEQFLHFLGRLEPSTHKRFPLGSYYMSLAYQPLPDPFPEGAEEDMVLYDILLRLAEVL